jgi:hypothetical protein
VWDAGKELFDPPALTWVSPGLFVEAGPPELCSRATAPMLKPAKAIATAAATMDSVDNFIALMCFAATP